MIGASGGPGPEDGAPGSRARAAAGRAHPVRTTAALVLPAAAVGAVCWFVGMDAGHALAVGLVLLAVAVVLRYRSRGDPPPWLRDAPGEPDGVRQDVTRLSWALRPARRGVPDAGVRRVRALARARLARVGLSPDDPAHREAIATLLGARAAGVLRETGRPVSLADIVAVLDAVDALDAGRRIAASAVRTGTGAPGSASAGGTAEDAAGNRGQTSPGTTERMNA